MLHPAALGFFLLSLAPLTVLWYFLSLGEVRGTQAHIHMWAILF